MKLLPGMKRLDGIFSQFIRIKAADEYGMAVCVTCGVRRRWNVLQAGHWITRDRWATRYDERNVHPQCENCNSSRAKDGEMKIYITENLGADVPDDLRLAARKPSGLNRAVVRGLIDEYLEKLREVA